MAPPPPPNSPMDSPQALSPMGPLSQTPALWPHCPNSPIGMPTQSLSPPKNSHGPQSPHGRLNRHPHGASQNILHGQPPPNSHVTQPHLHEPPPSYHPMGANGPPMQQGPPMSQGLPIQSPPMPHSPPMLPMGGYQPQIPPNITNQKRTTDVVYKRQSKITRFLNNDCSATRSETFAELQDSIPHPALIVSTPNCERLVSETYGREQNLNYSSNVDISTLLPVIPYEFGRFEENFETMKTTWEEFEQAANHMERETLVTANLYRATTDEIISLKSTVKVLQLENKDLKKRIEENERKIKRIELEMIVEKRDFNILRDEWECKMRNRDLIWESKQKERDLYWEGKIKERDVYWEEKMKERDIYWENKIKNWFNKSDK